MANNISKIGLGILQPIVQYGFAGTTVLLLAIVCWTMYRDDQRFDKVLEMQQQSNLVIERNTAAISDLSRLVRDRDSR